MEVQGRSLITDFSYLTESFPKAKAGLSFRDAQWKDKRQGHKIEYEKFQLRVALRVGKKKVSQKGYDISIPGGVQHSARQGLVQPDLTLKTTLFWEEKKSD